jgi:predicted nucleic acid-binding protein
MSLVIDASIACKWFFEEQGSAEARAILATGELLLAPELIIPEVCNVAWRRLASGQIGVEQGRLAITSLAHLIDEFATMAELAGQAFDIAAKLSHPVYDCFYLALSEVTDSHFITADQKLVQRLEGSQWQARIRSLFPAR